MPNSPKVSVIIPAYNEQSVIKKTLDSLVNQESCGEFEVIFVDNASTDKTKSIANSYKDKLNISVIDEKTKGRGAARATGFKHAKGEILLSLDADTIAPTDWICNMIKNFSDPKVIAVTGPWKIKDQNNVTNFWVNNLQEIANFPYRLAMGHYWITGLNFGIRKSVYERAGGFDATLNAHEDIDLTGRVRKYGKIKYAWDVAVETSGRRYKKGFFAGLWDYQKTAINYFLLGNKNDILDDKR